jgi:hypothetical protein
VAPAQTLLMVYCLVGMTNESCELVMYSYMHGDSIEFEVISDKFIVMGTCASETIHIIGLSVV